MMDIVAGFDWIAQFNPSKEFIDNLRTVNVIGGLVAFLALLFVLGIPRWREWNVATRLGWMALVLFCFTAVYSTFEVKYLDTLFRVPMVSISILWAFIAALWPREESIWPHGKKRDDA